MAYLIPPIQSFLTLKNLEISPTDSRVKIDGAAQKQFIANYHNQALKSAGLGLLTLGCASWALLQYATHHSTSALRSIAVAAVLGMIWFMRNNDPGNLAKKAFKAIQIGQEQAAIEFIQKGAHLDRLLLKERGAGQLIPFIPFFTFYPPLEVSLLEEAAFYSLLKVCAYLISIGFNLKNTRVLNMAQHDEFKTIKALVEAGVPVEMGTFPHHTPHACTGPLEGQLYMLCTSAKQDLSAKVLVHLKIANYLLKKGAKGPESRDDYEMVRDMNRLIEKIQAIPLEQESESLQLVIDLAQTLTFKE